MKKSGKIHIGCSGWNYAHWRGRFYPEESRQEDWFALYASVFDTVEINNTFYRLPPAETFAAWRDQAPAGFLYAVKANRYLTHMKKLKDAEESLKTFLTRARLLEDHLGPILYQLPPRWRLNRQRLESFLDLLPSDLTHVFEFRDQSWMIEEIFELLEERNVSFCVHDFPGLEVPRRAEGPVAYVRFHGTEGTYRGGYAYPTLRKWLDWMRGQSEEGRQVYVYFNNDIDAQAIRDARLLKQKAGI
jgi:uncharacterized protein YecE (DUF72 family)